MRHRRFLVSTIVLLALAAGGVAAGRVTQSPIVATITLGSTTYLPSPVVDGRSGHAFFVTGFYGQSASQAMIRMLDTRGGRMVRTLKMPWFNNGLGIGGVDERAGRLYVVAGAVTGNNVFLFDTKTGKRVAATHIDDPGADLLVDAAAGRVYVLSSGAVDPTTGQIGPGTVSVADASSGRVLRTLAVGMDVMALTLDAQAGRLLVSHSPSYIPIVAPDPWGWIPRQVRRRLPFIPQTAPRPRRMPAQLTIIDTGRL